MAKLPDTILRENSRWIEIGQAARFSRFKAVMIQAEIDAGTLRSYQEDGRTFILMADGHRLKREIAVVRAARRPSIHGPSASSAPMRAGPHASREVQDVLPMSSGRGGRGWVGAKPHDR